MSDQPKTESDVLRYQLTPRMRTALERLRYECDYEDDRVGDEKNYVTIGQIAPGIGVKTLSDLKERGLIEVGINRWHNCEGYRITTAGREALW